MMTPTKISGLIIGLVILLLIYSSVYVVTEGQQALLLRLGNIEINPHNQTPYIIGPGLHCKLPLITNIRIFDTRLQTLDIKSSNIITAEQKDLIVDYYVKWRITNLPAYYTSTSGNIRQASILLEQQL